MGEILLGPSKLSQIVVHQLDVSLQVDYVYSCFFELIWTLIY